MEISDISVLILTGNEAANLADTLTRLQWASQIIVVDSYSDDDTVNIAGQFANVRVLQRRFDHFAEQCNFGLQHVNTPWALSLDADYKCPPTLRDEIAELDGSCAGYLAAFQYCVYGRPLRATLYPPRIILYRVSLARYERDGHAHKVQVDGSIGKLTSRISHDDRKPLAAWYQAQQRYAAAEAANLLDTPAQGLGWKDRLRCWPMVAPVLTLLYCLFVKLLLLDGAAGLFYTAQRVYAELLLSLELMDHRLKN